MAPVVVQRRIENKDIGVTLNTYTSVFDKFREKEIDKVNQYDINENLNLKSSKNILDSSNDLDR